MTEVLVDRSRIKKMVETMARRISRDYKDGGLTVIIVLKGAFFFGADLIRKLECPLRMGFVRASSYRGTERDGNNDEYSVFDSSLINDRKVLLIEDIIDTGVTAYRLIERIKTFKPRDIGICSLLVKDKKRRTDIPLYYKGFDIPDRFVVGYGLDYNEDHRESPDIFALKETE